VTLRRRAKGKLHRHQLSALPLLAEPYLLSGSYILISEWCGDVGSIGSDDYLLDGRRVFSRDCAN